ncbi:MAG TPA: EamA family transporter [Stellaceae bacterium]|nr:EamA family transporter [Stellaceae bacterium]
MESLMPYYVMLIVGIAIAAGGQLFLKTGAMRSATGLMQFLDAYTILGLVCYGVSAVLYIIVLKKIPLSRAYPTVALSYAVVAIAAHFLWHERIGFSQIAGIAFIWGGILLIYRP